MRESITIMVPPQNVVLAGGAVIRSDQSRSSHVSELSRELCALTGRPVPVVVETLAKAPASGFLLAWEEFEIPFFPDLGPRTIVMHASRESINSRFPEERIQDRYALAGAFEEGGHFHGLVPVAERAGMRILAGNRLSAYRTMVGASSPCTDAQMLVQYLTAYEEMGLHLRKVTP